MKKFALILLLLLSTAATAEAAENKDIRLMGVGLLTSTSPYIGDDSEATVVPVVKWDYKNLFVEGATFGYRAFSREPWKLSVIGVPRFMGYDSGDSNALVGMRDRRPSFDAGLQAEYDLPWISGASVSFRLLTDALSRSRGQEATFSLSKRFKGWFFEATPAVGLKYQTKRLVDYYYGVLSNEATSARPEYEPGSTVSYFSGLIFNFGLSPKWIVVTSSQVEFLGREIRKSPVVGTNYATSFIIGLTRRF